MLLLSFIAACSISPFHELGHALTIHYFKPDLEIKCSFTHTECNWKQLNNKELRTSAIAGTIYAILTTFIISLLFYLTFILMNLETMLNTMQKTSSTLSFILINRTKLK